MTPLSRDLDLSTEATISRVVSVPGRRLDAARAREGNAGGGRNGAAAAGGKPRQTPRKERAPLPTGDFSTFNRGTALSAGRRQGLPPPGQEPGKSLKLSIWEWSLWKPRQTPEQPVQAPERQREPRQRPAQGSGLRVRQGFLGLRHLGKGILNLGIHRRTGQWLGSGFLFLLFRRKTGPFLFRRHTGRFLLRGNASGFRGLLLRPDSGGFLLGGYSGRLFFRSDAGGLLLGCRLFRRNPVRLRLFCGTARGFLLFLGQLGRNSGVRKRGLATSTPSAAGEANFTLALPQGLPLPGGGVIWEPLEKTGFLAGRS